MYPATTMLYWLVGYAGFAWFEIGLENCFSVWSRFKPPPPGFTDLTLCFRWESCSTTKRSRLVFNSSLPADGKSEAGPNPTSTPLLTSESFGKYASNPLTDQAGVQTSWHTGPPRRNRKTANTLFRGLLGWWHKKCFLNFATKQKSDKQVSALKDWEKGRNFLFLLSKHHFFLNGKHYFWSTTIRNAFCKWSRTCTMPPLPKAGLRQFTFITKSRNK